MKFQQSPSSDNVGPMTEDELARFGAPVVSGFIAFVLSAWGNRRSKRERASEELAARAAAKAEQDAADALQSRRAAIDARIAAAHQKAEEAHSGLRDARQEWSDGHHRVRKDVTEGLVEAYERLREVESRLAVVEDRTKREH